MDRVFIRDISLFGKHGVEDSERATAQEFVLDIVAEFDARNAVQSDELQDTVDYVPFLAIAKEVVELQSFHLIERIGSSIAEMIMTDVRIESVEVTVRKPAALKNGRPGVTIVRARS